MHVQVPFVLSVATLRPCIYRPKRMLHILSRIGVVDVFDIPITEGVDPAATIVTTIFACVMQDKVWYWLLTLQDISRVLVGNLALLSHGNADIDTRVY